MALSRYSRPWKPIQACRAYLGRGKARRAKGESRWRDRDYESAIEIAPGSLRTTATSRRAYLIVAIYV